MNDDLLILGLRDCWPRVEPLAVECVVEVVVVGVGVPQSSLALFELDSNA